VSHPYISVDVRVIFNILFEDRDGFYPVDHILDSKRGLEKGRTGRMVLHLCSEKRIPLRIVPATRIAPTLPSNRGIALSEYYPHIRNRMCPGCRGAK
jgi:hypothetical protein